jgi:hypothetical protein
MGYRALTIKSAIAGVLPNTESISIIPVGLHTLRITVRTYEPLFKIDETRGITKEGVIYTEFKDMSRLPVFFVASSTTKEVIRNGIPSVTMMGVEGSILNSLSEFIQKIDTAVFVVSKIYIDSFGDVTLYDKTGESKIIFSRETSLDKVWSNIVSAIDTEPLKTKLDNVKAGKDTLEYLDIRFGNKVFYKFTNGVKNIIIKDHEATSSPVEALPQ